MITLFLATVIGWYFIIAGLFLLFRRDLIRASMPEFINQPGLVMILGVFTVILGLLMVVSHNIWVLGWALIVTLISWLVLIIGLIRMFWPEVAVKMGQKFVNDPLWLNTACGVNLILGLILLYLVYFHY